MAGDDETPGPLGLPGLGDLFTQLEQATERLEAAADEARATVIEGSSAGGSVVVKLSGELEALSLHIDPALVDPSDVGMLEDVVLAALRDALSQLAEMQRDVTDLLPDGAIDVSALLGNLGGMLGNLSGAGGIGSLGTPDHLPGLGIGGLGDLLSSLGSESGEPEAPHVADDGAEEASGET